MTGSLAALLAQATPGPWHASIYDTVEEARIFGDGGAEGDMVAFGDGRRDLRYARNARLIALAPDLARLLVDMALAFEAEREQPGYLTDWHDELCSDKDDPEPCGACELLARFAEIERRAAE